jgi:hypothetical protein
MIKGWKELKEHLDVDEDTSDKLKALIEKQGWKLPSYNTWKWKASMAYWELLAMLIKQKSIPQARIRAWTNLVGTKWNSVKLTLMDWEEENILLKKDGIWYYVVDENFFEEAKMINHVRKA